MTSGLDASDNANVKRLARQGARVFLGHNARNLGDAAVVVVSTGSSATNPELAAAREKTPAGGAPRRNARRADALKQCVAIAGTHGKTTTTSLVATLLDAGGLDPTVINGASSTPMAPTRGWAQANGWWWRPTKATHLPQAAGRRPSSPISTRASRSFQDLRRHQGGLPLLCRKPALSMVSR